MNIFHKLATLAMLFTLAITAGAQTTPPAGTPVITLTVTQETNLFLSMFAAADNTPAWVETTPGTFSPITVGVNWKERFTTTTGSTLKVYGAITGFKCNCGGKYLTALDVSKNTMLTYLDCSNNQLTALDVSQNTALTNLFCYGNLLPTLNVSKNTALKILYCSNQLTTLDVSKNTALRELNCGGNQVTMLDISNNNELTSLDCSWNKLTSIDISKNTSLKKLDCGHNLLTTLDVSKNAALTELDCGINRLATLNLSKNIALTDLSCGLNPLTVLDVSKNIALTKLYCYNNYKLTALDLSKNIALTDLDCNSTPLTVLDVSKNIALTNLICDNTPLTVLDVSKNIALKTLHCYWNTLSTAAIDALYCSLPYRTAEDNATISPAHSNNNDPNQAAVLASNANNAIAKGWAVKYDYGGNIPTTGNYTCGTIPASDVTLNKTTATVEVGKTLSLTATVKPDNAANKAVAWSSSNSTVATVDNKGIVTGMSAGTATITAKAVGGNAEAKCIVTVNAPPPASTPVIILTVANNATVVFWTKATAPNTPVWVEATPGIYTIISTDTEHTTNTHTATGTTIKVYGDLSRFWCMGNEDKITALDVSMNTTLTELYCHNNRLTTLNIAQSPALKELKCHSNSLTTLNLAMTPALTSIECDWNQLTALDVSKNTELTRLTCSTNQLTTLDVSENTALKELYCSNNQLTTLDLSNNTELTDLNCSANQLTPDVSKNIALSRLTCSRNNLTTLDVSKNTALTELDCNINQLTALDVSKNIALTKLYCGSNQLTTLDISKNIALTDLDCSYNLTLTALDVSKNTALTYLGCSFSYILSALDVSKNTALKELYCSNNQLTVLDVSKNIALIKLVCYNNPFTSAAIDALYCSLPYRTADDNAIIFPAYDNTDWNHAAVLASNANNAITNSWAVKYNNYSNIPTMGNYTCGSTPVPATEVILDKTTATVVVNKTVALTATVKPDNAANKSVAWSSSNTAIATVDSKGIVTGVNAGTATITAKAVDGGAEAKCIITVIPQATLITLDKAAATVETGKTVALTATVKPDNAPNKSVAWSSSNNAIATVSSSGIVTGVSAGTATITAKAVDGGAEAKCIITVVTPVTLITLNKATATIELDKKIGLIATIKPDNATNKAVTWSSDNSAVATVNGNGMVTGVSTGTSTITAKTVDGGFEAKCTITVINPITIITLNKAIASVEAGKTVMLTATLKPDNNSNKAIAWSSNNSAIATVDNNGIVTGVSAGTATVTAKVVDESSEAKCIIMVTTTTDAETETETETVSTLCLYPNPAMAEIFIKGIEKPTLVEIYSTMGQLMLTQTLEPSQQINISRLQPGIYTVKVNEMVMKLMVAGR
jgi:uncharacterized protein YjdB/Leucine-rich repeat (LRR) protein